MYLSAVTLQLSRYMAGAITVAEVITMDGAIIIVGETSLGDHSERSRLRAAFFFVATCNGEVCSWQILLQKSFSPDARNFLGPLMRSARGDVRAHIILHKNDHGPSYRP
jgi:hypothetical protein